MKVEKDEGEIKVEFAFYGKLVTAHTETTVVLSTKGQVASSFTVE